MLGRSLTLKEKEKMMRMHYKEIEINMPNTIKYLNDRVWHGFDGTYYVSSIASSTGEFMAREYNETTFKNTYGKYLIDLKLCRRQGVRWVQGCN